MGFIEQADVQTHLPVDKLRVESIPDDVAWVMLDSERVIRGYLADVIDTAVLASWDTPETTPEVIRAIAGRLSAALIYRTRYSENSLTDPQFAQRKYDEAMAMLMDIINGEITLPDVVIGTDFSDEWFEPNNNSDPPKFTMADRY